MSHSMYKIILLLALSLLLSACASVPVELNRAAFEFEKIDAVVLSNEIGTISHQESVSGVDSGAMAGGLIGHRAVFGHLLGAPARCALRADNKSKVVDTNRRK